MTKDSKYDLEERTLAFAKNVRKFVRTVPKDVCNIEDCKQLVRSSGSIGANYREANESLSKKDFKMRIKISRKESKESRFWLNLIDTQNQEGLEQTKKYLVQESTELLKIFSAILVKSK
ncbi:MAG TPA: four helix bundle protein [Balneolaceae bacterium]|nr:four helix bundle protein [Balneolaceae bacterium]